MQEENLFVLETSTSDADEETGCDVSSQLLVCPLGGQVGESETPGVEM